MIIKKKVSKKVTKRKVSKKVFKDSRELSQWHLDVIKNYFENKSVNAFRELAKDKSFGIKLASPEFVQMVNSVSEETTREIAQSVMWQIAKEKILNKK